MRELLDWWMVDIRHQFGDDYTNLDAPLFPPTQTRSMHSTTRLGSSLA